MSYLASVTVHGCDGEGCTVLAVLQTEEQWETYGATWFDGLGRHFCPACKGSVRNAAAIDEEERKMDALRAVLRMRETSVK